VMRVGLLCVALVMVALSGMLVACGGGDDETLPPPTVIRAEDTPAVNAEPATITPTLTATPEEGYPPPPPTQPPAEEGYPPQPPTQMPTPGAYPSP